jgi:hypothetical protein
LIFASGPPRQPVQFAAPVCTKGTLTCTMNMCYKEHKTESKCSQPRILYRQLNPKIKSNYIYSAIMHRIHTAVLLHINTFPGFKVLSDDAGIWFLYTPAICFFFSGRCDPTRVMASTFFIFLDHTQRRSTVGRTPLDE